MQKAIHPHYYLEATVRCICGASWTTGATVPTIEVEICSSCHPFYTGREKILDTAGRVDRFRKIVEKSTRLGKEHLARTRQKAAETPAEASPEPK